MVCLVWWYLHIESRAQAVGYSAVFKSFEIALVVAISVIGGRDIWKRFLWGKPYSLINSAHILLAKMQAFVHTQLKRRLRNRFIVCLGKEKINFAEDLGNLFLNPKFIWLQILVPLYIVLIHEYEIINCELNNNELALTAATAKSLQSCPILCDPIDSSLSGSPVPGILQARTLEWVAISFSSAWKWKVKVKSLRCVQPSATPWAAAFQAPPSMRFSSQEYWSGVPLSSPSTYREPIICCCCCCC